MGQSTSGGADLITIDSPAAGQNRISGTSGGVPFESVTFYDVANFTLDTGTNDLPGDDADSIIINSTGLVASGLQTFIISTGDGDDVVDIVPSANAVITYMSGAGWDELVMGPQGGAVALSTDSIVASGMEAITYSAQTEEITVDEDVVVSTDTTFNARKYNLNDLIISSNSTLTLSSDMSATGFQSVEINANNLTVEAGSTLSADGQGYGRSSGPGAGESVYNYGYYGSGGGYGGAGGNVGMGLVGGSSYGSLTEPVDLGSGGGGSSYSQGSAGGGAIHLTVSGTLTIDGQISADGSDGVGGGSGGSVYIIASTLAGSGVISADGGYGATNNGGGGGGRIALYYDSSTYTGTLSVLGGTGYEAGGAGTIYMKSASQANGELLVDNGGITGASTVVEGSFAFDSVRIEGNANLYIPTGSVLETTDLIVTQSGILTNDGNVVIDNLTFDTGVITNNGVLTLTTVDLLPGTNVLTNTGQLDVPSLTVANLTLRQAGVLNIADDALVIDDTGTMVLDISFEIGSMTINSGGVLTHSQGQSGFALTIIGDMTINAGGSIDVEGRGYGGSLGPGAGTYNYYGSSGAGYGGEGGEGYNGPRGHAPGGATYGSIVAPTDLGSGGGSGGSRIGGSGGGAILLNVAGTLLVDGVISANGGDGKDGLYSGSGGGGGSGGSVYLVVGTLSGTGSILANGGDGGRGSPTYYPSYHSAGGGGGIIYITAGEIDSSFKISADGGTSDGKAGGSGGRIALVYDAGSYNYRGNTSTYGGSGSGPDGWGQYGTVLINGLSLAEITGIYHWAGTITEDTSWNYPVLVVHGPLIIAENATLTVEAGTIVKLGGLGHIVIFVYGGGLLATTGTVDSPVVFTSHLDDSMGGDTNFDGDATIAMHDDWYGISLCNYGRVDLIHTEIRYANTAIFIGTFLKYGTINLSAVTLRENGVGIYVYAPYTQVTADNCLIVDNFYTGVFVRATSLNIFRNCTIVGNGFGSSGWMGAGIHLGAAILTLENSIVAFNQNGLHHGTNADYPTLLIRYSDFYNPAGQEIVWEWGGEPQLDNNGNVLADPLFVDRSAGNYNLDTASPVIDAGLGIHAPSTDIRGRVRFDDLGMPNLGSGYPSYVDMGAYERQVSTPAGDLSVIYVADPDPMFLSAGDSVTIEWTVANVGNVELTGTWQDVVYLSDDPYLGGDQLFATVDHTGLLVAGASYSQTVAATVTGVSGPKYILIYTNANSSVQEASDMNNVAAASHVLAVDVPLLEIGTPQSATAIPYQWDYYRFEAEPGHTVLFSLDTAAYVYLRRGLPPTFADYDVAAGQKLRLLDPLASTYYLGVLPRWRPGGPTVYTLSADLTTLDIREVTPNEVGNNGTATIKILGDDFSPEADVQLIAPDGVVIEGKEYYQDSATLFATFDLAAAGAAPGQYDVVVINPDPELVTAVGVVTVMPGGAAAFDINLTIPGTSRPGRNIDVCIEYRNTGNIDLQSPLLTLESIEGTAWLLPDEYPENTWIESPSVSFLALSKDGPASTLRPGQSRMFIITARTPFIGAGSSMPFELYAFGTPDQIGLSDVIDWVQIGNDLAPPDSLSESWDPLFDRFVTQIGSTWGDYLDMLRVNANGLAEAGQRVHNVTELLGFEFIQAAALGTLPYFESAQDAFIPAPSLPLSFERYFLPGPSYRHRMGSLGYGWTHSYDITLRHRTDDSIVINGASGFDRIFTPNGSGGYTGGTGDFATLTPITEGGVTEYLLTETTGLETYFRSDGRFSYIEDTNSNRISASYNGLGQLVALTHTSGDRFEFTYDANGRLETLTDHVNRITTFGYDATGEHLTSVTTPGGLVTTYNYITGEGTLRDHLITEITPPGDPSVHFDYDTLGRMQHQHIATGFEPVDFVYSDAGRTAITDALSNTSTTWIDSRGRTILAENPLGYRTKLVYDTMSNLIEVISPTGVSTAFAYDDLGNLTSTRDPMGFVTSFSYDGPFTQLSMLRDANGNITRYAYDDRGNLTSITYADTSVETYHYNGVGNLDFYTNRRAQTIAYTYNSRGQLLTKYNTYTPGIIDFHYTYDSVGNLIEATNDVGTITLDYFGPIHPNADQLQRITYPEGQWLSYTYNQAGQRTTMIDQLGHVLTYAYDVAGRLWTITDEADAQAVEYLYDPVGRLQAKTLGNGVYTTYGYDPTGQLLDLFNHNPDDSVLSRFEYTYDPFGRRTTMTTTYGVDDPRPAGTWNYMYDNVGQLVAWTDPTGHHVEYIYDPMGNRLQEIDDDIVTDYVVNNLNQYTSVGGVPYLYDLDGNLIDINNGETIYTYNADNRFIATSGSEGSFSYQYDALGQRYLVDNESEQVIHITDPFGFGNLVGEYDATTGQQIAQHDHGFGLFQTFQPQNWDETFSYTFDALGNTVDVIRGSGFDDVHNIVYPDGESVVFGVLDATYGVFGGGTGPSHCRG